MYVAEKPKRMKADSDNARLSPAMRNLETCANMKDEQVCMSFASLYGLFIFFFSTFKLAKKKIQLL